MKLRHRILCSLLVFFLFSTGIFGESRLTGLELCDSIYNSLKKSNFTPYTQSLVTSGENTFPYNIGIKIPGNQNSGENLVFVFFQEDAASSPALINDIITSLSAKSYDFDITVLFAYGEKQKIERSDMIFGSRVFLESLNSNLNYTTIIFDFDNEEYGIKTSSSGLSSPSWLIQNTCNTLLEANLGKKLPRFFLSQVSGYKFAKNRILSAFFENEIPAIILDLKKSDIQGENAKSIILDTAEKFNSTEDKSWEHHFMMMRLFGRYHTLSEEAILKIIIPIIFAWILFVFMLFFINSRLKKRAWSTVKKIWYSAPVIYGLVVFSFFFMRFWFNNILINASAAGRIYGILTAQIIGALFISELFFILILIFNRTFEERSIDYLLVVCCFINQSIFVLIDISLCPIFMTVCFLSLAALGAKNNFLHVCIFVLMILIFVPYGNAVIIHSDIASLSHFITKNSKMIFIISLALYPCFLILLRILTSVRSHRKNLYSIIAGASVVFVLISIALIVTALVRTRQINKKQVLPPSIAISQEGENLISIDYNDLNIFDDTIRTLNIDLAKSCIICDVQIITQTQNPILYTDNDFKSNAENSISFSIPDYPPSHLTFSYGANPVPCKIIVSAVINDTADDNYRLISKSLQIGETR